MLKANKALPEVKGFSRKYGNILGVNITGTQKQILLTEIDSYLAKIGHFKAGIDFKRPLFVTTPNPEQVVLSQKDPQFKKVLESSDVALCDGVGLLAAHEFFLRKVRDPSNFSNRLIKTDWLKFAFSLFYVLKNGRSSDGMEVIKGRDFLTDLLALSDKKKYKIFLLGSTKTVLEKAVKNLSEQFPSVQFRHEWDLNLNENGVPADKQLPSSLRSRAKSEEKQSSSFENEARIIKNINKFHPQMLFVAFGAPKQEKWVYRNLKKLKSGLIMVVGGSFDYIAGTRTNVPMIIEKFGLEWLWRLLTGSQKWERVRSAVIKFPSLLIKNS